MADLFPVFLKLEGRKVLVVGAGNVGEQKISGLLSTGAFIRVVAPQATELVRQWAVEGRIRFDQRGYAASDLDDMALVIVATAVTELNRQVYSDAQQRGILCNIVDVPEQCDFYYPAVVRRGDLQIAISTSGQSPSLAQRIREQIEQQFGPAYAGWVKELGEVRRRVLGSSLHPERKRYLLQSLASRAALDAEVERQKISPGGLA